MRRLLIINNVPTPYRTFMFNKMHEKGREFGVEVTVAFQAERLSYRAWDPNEDEMKFPHFFSTGLNPFSTAPLPMFTYRTFSTDILRAVASRRFEWVLVAPLLSVGSWAIALIPAGKTQKLLWSESNLTSARFVRGPVRWFKGVLVSPFAALVCPGQRAADYVWHLNPRLRGRPVIWLPNIVDTSVYWALVQERRAEREETRRELGVEPDQTLVLGVGQMIERKGYARLIEAASHVQGTYRIVMLGEGPLRQAWAREVVALGLADRVQLPGEVDGSQLPRYLAAADWFVHPALRDPSPLVVVEAGIAGLPLAVSAQTGNAREAVRDDVNGFTFDAADQASVTRALQRIADTNVEERRIMGEISSSLAREYFDPDAVIGAFFRGLLST